MADYVVGDFETQSACDLKKCGVEKYARDASTRVLCFGYIWPDGTEKLWKPGDPIDCELAEHIRAGRLFVAHNAPFELAIWEFCMVPLGWPKLEAKQVSCTMARALALGLPASLAQCAQAMRLPLEKDEAGHRVMMKLAKPRRVSAKERVLLSAHLGRSVATEISKAVIASPIFWEPADAPEDFAKLYAYCLTDNRVEHELHKILPELSAKERTIWLLDRVINNRGVPIDVVSANRALEIVAEEHAEFSERIRQLTGGFVPSANARNKLLEWLRAQGVQLAGLKKADVAAILETDDETEAEPLTPEFAARLMEGEAEDHAYPAKLPEHVRAVLEVRREAAKASTAKFKAMINSACDDGIARGLFQYWGAGPGRWAGRRIQTQNMPRTPKFFKPEHAAAVIDWLHFPNARLILKQIAACIQDEANAKAKTPAERVRVSVMDLLSWSLRSFIKARPGMKFLCSDYSNIEGRGIAFLAGEEPKLEAFRAYDTLTGGVDAKGEPLRAGPDVYIRAVAGIYGIPIEAVTPEQRQAEGKVSELALGYQGGVGAFLNMAAGYNIDLDKMAAAVKAASAPEAWDLAAKKLPRPGSRWRYDLEADTWIGIRVIVDGWRKANPAISKFWYMLDESACGAVEAPSVPHWAGPYIAYKTAGDFLLCKLPSGRCLSYPYPEMRLYPSAATEKEIDDIKAELLELEHKETEARGIHPPLSLPDILGRTGELVKMLGQINGELEAELRGEDLPGAKRRCEMRLVHQGLNTKNKWARQRLYGGLLAENVTQATARDVLAEALLRCEAAGLSVVMHVHDEILVEVPDDGSKSETDLAHIMCAVEPWAAQMPIAAAGWSGYRYRK